VVELSGNKDTILRINASEVYVTFTSDGNNTDKGFLFTYTSEKSSVTYCKSNDLSPNSPDVLKTATGTINPIAAGQKYEDANTCLWALRPDGIDPNRGIGIVFTKFDLDEGDFVELNKWSGTIGTINVKYFTHKVARFTKENKPELGKEYQIKDAGAFIRFRTDNNLNGTGFELKWDASTHGINEVQIGIEKMSIYPNPATDKVKIQIETVEPETVQLSLYDILGRAVSKIPAVDATQQFVYDMDVSHLAKGIYMLRITTSKGQIMRKVVVQ
jgi:hypothetical protein